MIEDPLLEHPSEEDLRRYQTGTLAESASEEIKSHLARCDACKNFLLAQTVASDAAQNAGEQPSEETFGTKPTVLQPGLDSVELAGALIQKDKSLDDITIEGYEIVEELARGGMGVVYRAKHHQLKREVALKVILSGAHSSIQDRQRFFREAETIAQLQHPGIVQIFDVGEQDGHPYLALELVEGNTLRDIIDGSRQPVRWTATMLLQLARAVQFAHQQGVIHRDLKPGNVLCRLPRNDESDSNDHLWSARQATSTTQSDVFVPFSKITDFGLAKQVDRESDITKTGQVAGTPSYMAPEQALGQNSHLSPATDVYALGVILYEMLVGRVPFTGDDALTTLMAVISDDPISPRKYHKEVPRDLETICLKCLMKDPKQRYESAQQLANDLELFLADEPILARPLSIVGQVYRWARRRPVLATAVFTTIVFYSLHLFALYVLKLPKHEGLFHWVATGMIGVWCLCSYFIQKSIDANRGKPLPMYAFMALCLITVTFMFMLDQGPQSAPVNVYLLFIVVGIFMLPRPSFVWFSTALAFIGYVSLTVYAFAFDPDVKVPMETTIAVLLSIIVMGVCMHLILRRSQHPSATMANQTTLKTVRMETRRNEAV